MTTVRRRTKAVIGLAAGAMVLFASARPASAHAELESTSPSSGEVVATTPSLIELRFSEAINVVDDSIRLVDGTGAEIAVTNVGQADGSTSATADVPPLADGTYVVAWHVVSADSHPISGAFTFSVGAASVTDPGLLGSLSSSPPDTAGEAWLGLGRAASFLGIALLIGSSTVVLICAGDLLRGRRLRRLIVGGGIVGAIGTAVMIVAQAHVTIGEASRWRDVYDTRAGQWWFVRLALIVVLVAGAAVATRFRLGPRALVIGCGIVLGLALLAVVAAGGHGVTGRHAGLAFAATVAHLAAMSTWVGGVAALAVVVPRDRLWNAAHRFSPIAFVSVAVLAGTGVVNAWRQSDSWDALVDSTYGRWLLVKVVVITFIVSVASANRWLVQTTDAAAEPPVDTVLEAASTVGAAELEPDAGRVLRRTVLLEAVALLVVFAATAGLVNSPPPRDVPAVATPTAAVVTVTQGDRVAVISLDPAVSGGTVLDVTMTNIVSATDVPTEISVSATLPDQAIGPLDIPVVIVAPGHATAAAADLPIAGLWTIVVSARYSEFDQITFAAEIQVR